MSLLMDALRKAEESKKQAEQEYKKPEETGLPESQEEPVGTAAPDPEVSTSSIPDTQIEFEENPGTLTDMKTAVAAETRETVLATTKNSAVSARVPAAEPSGEAPQELGARETGMEAGMEIGKEIGKEVDKETALQERQADDFSHIEKQGEASVKVALSLEPMDESARSQARKPLDVSAPPDYSAESQLKSESTASTKSEHTTDLPPSATSTDLPTSDNKQQELEAAMLRASSKFAGTSKQGVSGESRATPRSAPAESDNAADKDPKLGQPSVPTGKPASSRAKSGPAMASMAGKSNSSEKLETQEAPAPSMSRQASSIPEKSDAARPGIKLQKPGQSISTRSEPDRRAARSVFAAKLKGKPFRIRRSTKIWALQIVAGVALLGGGYVVFFATAPVNEFNVPAEYLSNAGSFSEDFVSEDFTDDVTAAVAVESVPETDVEPATALAVSGLQEPVTTAMIEESVTSTPAAADGQSQLLPGQVATVAVLDEQIVPTPEAVAVEARADTAAAVVESAVSTIAGIVDAALGAESETSAPAATPPGISFVRRETVSTVDPMLRQAYEAYQRGELSVAQSLYQQVLTESPQQRDAMLGLAAIASSNQDALAAMQLYSGLLARDPSDSVARAGLLALRPAGSIADQEREFRRLLAQQGNVAAVVYAVGNFYATQGRWNEAQRHYFNALQLAKADQLNGIPVNPDYAFNLAVSLERINQADVAGTYYQEAITFAASHTASFDLSIARSRLASLAEVGS